MIYGFKLSANRVNGGFLGLDSRGIREIPRGEVEMLCDHIAASELVKVMGMRKISPTVKYQMIWREYELLIAKMLNLLLSYRKQQKYILTESFIWSNPSIASVHELHDGRMAWKLNRNMVNYYKRCDRDVETFKKVVLKCSECLHGSGVELFN